MKEIRDYFKNLFSNSIIEEDIMNIDTDLLQKLFDYVCSCLSVEVLDNDYYINMFEECRNASKDVYILLIGLKFLDPYYDVLNSSYYLDAESHKKLTEDKFGVYNDAILSLEKYMFEYSEIKKNNR